MAESLKLFFSYSHKDEALRDELGNHLKILEYQGLISSWHDRKILAGDLWDDQININQETADIILLLISSDFIASRYCWDIEIKRAMELHDSGNACVIPVILRSADWTNAPFSKLQAVPKNAQPVTSFPDRDAAFQFVTQQIRQVVADLIERRNKQRQQKQKEIDVATYRQKFYEFASDGEISGGERFILRDLQKKRGLTDSEVQLIEQEILTPAASQEYIDSYREAFLDAINQYGYPLDNKARNDLKLVQEYLGLSDIQVTQVETPIASQKEAEQKELLEQRRAELASKIKKVAKVEQELSVTEAELKTRMEPSRVQELEEALGWLSNQAVLAEKVGKATLERFPSLRLSESESRRFNLELKQYFELIYHSLLEQKTKLLRAPKVPQFLSNSAIYEAALDELKNRMPEDLGLIAQQEITERIDYLKRRIS
ncbi:toll/interleukin-1 receptor domain-containing protein [Oculatella sp. FACHB-28]|uniref:TIR domain-containing protein n=1 Tax=Oculatella sp. FACHB-28 TaxID=2692845 RepID=UPI0016878809|nr:toll/interleukin-1 receptor domain-containing protein [Oculatella sp. FACHB-28]